MERFSLKQQCPLAFVVLAWLLYLGGTAFLALAGMYPELIGWLVGAPLLMWAYIRWFPAISRYLGYGSVEDRSAISPPRARTAVTLYTALGCPFCPILRRRLEALQPRIGFDLREVDVTARPDVLIRKGAWSVPVVEADGRLLIGNATSDQLIQLIVGAGVAESEGAATREAGQQAG